MKSSMRVMHESLIEEERQRQIGTLLKDYEEYLQCLNYRQIQSIYNSGDFEIGGRVK